MLFRSSVVREECLDKSCRPSAAASLAHTFLIPSVWQHVMGTWDVTERGTRRELYDRVRPSPMRLLAKEFSLTTGAPKMLQRHGVPMAVPRILGPEGARKMVRSQRLKS